MWRSFLGHWRFCTQSPGALGGLFPQRCALVQERVDGRTELGEFLPQFAGGCDVIASRNVGDFHASPIVAHTPTALLALLQQEGWCGPSGSPTYTSQPGCPFP